MQFLLLWARKDIIELILGHKMITSGVGGVVDVKG